jgi:hypothetical protein
MASKLILPLAGIALVIAIASGSKAGVLNTPAIVRPKKDEIWCYEFSISPAIPNGMEAYVESHIREIYSLAGLILDKFDITPTSVYVEVIYTTDAPSVVSVGSSVAVPIAGTDYVLTVLSAKKIQ